MDREAENRSRLLGHGFVLLDEDVSEAFLWIGEDSEINEIHAVFVLYINDACLTGTENALSVHRTDSQREVREALGGPPAGRDAGAGGVRDRLRPGRLPPDALRTPAGGASRARSVKRTRNFSTLAEFVRRSFFPEYKRAPSKKFSCTRSRDSCFNEICDSPFSRSLYRNVKEM